VSSGEFQHLIFMSVSPTATREAAHRTSRSWPFQKLKQLWRLVRESYAQPMMGKPQKPVAVKPEEVGITFIGHSSFLLQIGGRNILIDPVFSTRLILLRRQRRPGVRVEDLPAIDLVLVTHAHMDHLNVGSLRGVVRRNQKLGATVPTIVVPAGVDDLVKRLGFARVETLNVWQSLAIADLNITMTPCKHWGARLFNDTHREFGGYAIQAQAGGPAVYHSGDTAYFSGFREIGARLHPDIALLPIGAYFPDSYRSVHTSPEEAVQAFLDTGAKWMVPMHYGTFRLGREPMNEPLERLAAETVRLGLEDHVRVVTEGETLRLASGAVAHMITASC
jgi:L-ascorbate metabolism protein UlaG (beta-lactamase superfamily)